LKWEWVFAQPRDESKPEPRESFGKRRKPCGPASIGTPLKAAIDSGGLTVEHFGFETRSQFNQVLPQAGLLRFADLFVDNGPQVKGILIISGAGANSIQGSIGGFHIDATVLSEVAAALHQFCDIKPRCHL
jgi:hypothetical protein